MTAGPVTERHADQPRADRFGLSPQQVTAFDTFGFLLLPGLLAEDIDAIGASFERIMATRELEVVRCDQFYDASASGLLDRPRLAVTEPVEPLVRHPRIDGVVSSLLGPDPVHTFAQANLFNCDVHWHNDGIFTGGAGRHVLLMIYLDPLTASSGALRVLPGSHHAGPFRQQLISSLTRSERPLASAFGTAPDELPATVLAVEPGDVIALDFDLFHASFGGGVGRRSITMGFGPPA